MLKVEFMDLMFTYFTQKNKTLIGQLKVFTQINVFVNM